MRSLLAGICFSALLFFTAGPAQAEPIKFVNWTETWIFPTEGDDGEVDGYFIGGFESQSDEYELFDVDPSVISERDEERGGWVVDITLPNFVDPLPKKKIFIEFEGEDDVYEPEDLPSVLSIVAFDTPPGTEIVNEISCPPITVDCKKVFEDIQFQEGTGEPDSDDLIIVREAWVIQPNPDWEIVTVFIPDAFELYSFHLFTTSFGVPVPEPGPLALVTTGLAGLGFAGRRRR